MNQNEWMLSKKNPMTQILVTLCTEEVRDTKRGTVAGYKTLPSLEFSSFRHSHGKRHQSNHCGKKGWERREARKAIYRSQRDHLLINDGDRAQESRNACWSCCYQFSYGIPLNSRREDIIYAIEAIGVPAKCFYHTSYPLVVKGRTTWLE